MNFKKIVMVYSIFLILISTIFLLYVNSCLSKFEKSQINNYVTSIEKDFKSAAKWKKISKYIKCNNSDFSKYEKSGASYEKGLNQLIKNSTLSHKLNFETKDKKEPIYDIYADEQKIATVKLRVKQYVTKLVVLNYPEWEIVEIKPCLDEGLYNYNITVPSSYKVKVNGNELSKEDISKESTTSSLDDFNKYASIPSSVTYHINKFANKPEIKIVNENGRNVDYTENGNCITATTDYFTTNNTKEALSRLKTDFNILAFAEKWSLFLTNDLNGGTHGFESLKPNLVNGSYMWKMAYAWATSIDITFTSSHTLKNPAFTNESISNFVIYNDCAFSCDVYLEKNMNVARIGSQTDTMNERMYFVYLDGNWKLVGMQAITGNK